MTPEESAEVLVRKFSHYELAEHVDDEDKLVMQRVIADAIRRAVAEEREACAKIAEAEARWNIGLSLKNVIKEIRSRSKSS